jgi:radical SAM-linked protein
MPPLATDNQATAAHPPVRVRVALRYRIDGDLRFLAHHDEIRLLSRALRRARWPLVYSEGFNPLPKLSIAMPRGVGVASDCQFAVATLDRALERQVLADRLRPALPEGCTLLAVEPWAAKTSPRPAAATYAVGLEPDTTSNLQPRISALLAEASLPYERDDGPQKPRRSLDLRPFIDTITRAGDTLTLRLAYVQQRTARAYEILDLLGLEAANLKHRVRLVAVDWQTPDRAGATSAETHRQGMHCGQDNQEEDAQAHHSHQA